jgi:hypothetical protein
MSRHAGILFNNVFHLKRKEKPEYVENVRGQCESKFSFRIHINTTISNMNVELVEVRGVQMVIFCIRLDS